MNPHPNTRERLRQGKELNDWIADCPQTFTTSIGEVQFLTGLKAHVLRYWESQFDMISPNKNRGGSRVYRMRDIESVLLVKHLLYEKRFTVEGAKRELKEMRGAGRADEARSVHTDPAVLQSIKKEIASLREVLTLPAG